MYKPVLRAVVLTAAAVAVAGSALWAAGTVSPSADRAPSAAARAEGRLKTPAGQREASKKLGLSPRQRLERAFQRDSHGDALLAATMHTIERGLSLPANQRTSQYDQIFEEVLKRHPNVPKQFLKQLAAAYRSLPRALRTRGAPASLADLPAAQPLSASVVNAAVRASLPAVQSPSLVRVGESRETTVVGVASAAHNLGAAVDPAVIEAMLNPRIASIEPAAPKGYDPGQTITLVGWNFSANKSDNEIAVFKELAGGSKGAVASLNPTVASAQALEMKIPDSLTPGHYYIQVSVKKPDKPHDGNMADLYIKAPPPPPPVIQSISPRPQFPGRRVLINGLNLGGKSPIAGVWFKPMENQPLASYVTLNGEKVGFALGKVLNATQIEVTIPPLLMAGKYRVALEAPGAGMSQWFEYEVRPFRYQLNFTQIKCKDESDPEWAGGDELVVAWVIVGDNTAYAKSTGDHSNYENFDDGDTDTFHPADRTVFFPAGGPGEVKKVLAINTTLYEWDAGDVKAVNEVVGFVGDLASEILTGTGQVEWAVVVQVLTPIVQKVVSWVGGNPDHLGDRQLAWSALDLLEQTNNPEGRFTGTLDFDNSDDDGSYRLSYEVVRVAE